MRKIYRTTSRVCFCLLTMIFTLFCGAAFAQNNITGMVISAEDKSPIIGATIQLVDTQKGSVTDMDGKFHMSVPAAGRLQVSYLGCETQNIALQAGKTSYSITLKQDTKTIEEVVVVGYGTMRKKEVTGAVTRLGGEEISKIATSDLGSALQGQIAGVTVQSAGGAPGTKSNIMIRGISSISGGNSPLYVVDGVPYDSDPGISENEIASIDILKDAASAAVYGTRGAGGVILITTKEGKKGKMKVSLDGYYGVQVITSTIDLMDANDRAYVDVLERMRNDNTLQSYDMVWSSIKSYQSSSFNDTNLMDVIQNTPAPIQNYSLNVSGGSKNLTYNVVGGFFNQDGVIINSGFDRYNMRANLKMDQGKWDFGVIAGYKLEKQQIPGWGLLTEAYKYNPMSSPIDPDADITNNATGDDNTINNMGYLMARLKEEQIKKTDNFNSNISIGYDIVKGLKATTRLGVNYTNMSSKTVNPLFQIYDTEGELKPNTNSRSSVREDSSRSTGVTWETMLNYNKKIKKHSFNATAVYSMEAYTFESFYAKVSDLITSDIGSLNAGTTDMLVGKGTGQWGQDKESALIGMLGRLQYTYDGRYMINGSIRRDGSSKFDKENRWGVFPSLSAGWNISQEKFWTKIKSTVNTLKLRGSFGTTGNQNFADYSYTTSLATHYDYIFGSYDQGGLEYAPGVAQSTHVNPQVKWETTQQINLGVDFGLFKNKLTGSFDIYQSNKSDMLFPLLLPPTGGTGSTSTITLNVGDMQNKGLELALAYRDNIGKFNYRVSGTFSTNQNEVTKMSASSNMFFFADGSPTSGTDQVTAVREGYPAGAFFVMPTNGVVNTAQKLAAYQQLKPNAKMGDLIYVDKNGDQLIDDNDRVYAGNGSPDYEIGLNLSADFKGLDFSMNWYASLGNEIINGSKVYTYQYKSHRDLTYQWSPSNTTSNIPSYAGQTHDNYRSYSDMWVEDGSFLRLKNVMLGYTLPEKWLKKMGISKIRIYAAADNLLTITKYTGYDPEVGNSSLARRGLDLGTYPISIQCRGGVQIGF